MTTIRRGALRPGPVVAHLAGLTRQPPHLWLVLGLVLLGLALRLWFIGVNQLEPFYSPADDGDYYQRALRLATTGRYLDDFWLIRPPLHVLLFALAIRASIFLGDVPAVLLIRLIQTAMIVLTIPVGYDLARRLFNRRAGLIFAAILAVWFPLVELPVHLFSEPTFFFFVVLHFWMLLRWRDDGHWLRLALSGVLLGFASLARSPTLIGGAFVLLWLVLEGRPWAAAVGPGLLQRAAQTLRQAVRQTTRPALIFGVACMLVVVPWTVRNYLTYERLILIDTIGPVNLWLHVEKYEERGVEMLKQMPQADRQVFAISDTLRIARADPVGFWGLLWRNAGAHFQHIWKAQFIEDFLVKRSFYGRPLRELWLLGVLGDGLWFLFTLAGLMALALPLREGAFRWLALGWIGYTIVAMMIMHIEPRYLLPVWLLLALYGSWLASAPDSLLRLLPKHPHNDGMAMLLAGGFIFIFLTYRDYPEIIGRGIRREQHNAAGMQAYAAGDYATAIAELRQASAQQPTFIEARANLALAYLAQGQAIAQQPRPDWPPAVARQTSATLQQLARASYDAAWRTLGGADSQRMNVVRGGLARAQGEPEMAAVYFIDAETRAGIDVQRFALAWLPLAPTRTLNLGDGRDLGYIAGFSPGEELTPPGAAPVSYRWLQGTGAIRLPLVRPLDAGSVLVLDMTAGPFGPVPLALDLGGARRTTIAVQGGAWRSYHLALPAALEGQTRLDLSLHAPMTLPAHRAPQSVDTRPLSLMLRGLRVAYARDRGESEERR